jgi:hypothetical protein
MSRTNTLLNTLNELKPTGAFPQRLLVRDAAVAATVEMDVHQLDKLSIELSMLRVSPEQASRVGLRDRAVALAQRVTGLMEKLNAIEIDDERGEALLRSDTPVAQDESRLYYELILQRQGVTTLHRYQGSTIKSSRKEVPFTLTREALAKLINDLAN